MERPNEKDRVFKNVMLNLNGIHWYVDYETRRVTIHHFGGPPQYAILFEQVPLFEFLGKQARTNPTLITLPDNFILMNSTPKNLSGWTSSKSELWYRHRHATNDGWFYMTYSSVVQLVNKVKPFMQQYMGGLYGSIR